MEELEKNPEQPETQMFEFKSAEEHKYDKIGGWLILPAIGLILTPLIIIINLASNHFPIIFSDTWATLTTPGSYAYNPLWAPVLIFEVVVNILMIAYVIYINVQFYSMKKNLPKLIIIYFAANLLIIIVDYFLTMQIPSAAQSIGNKGMVDVLRALIPCVIWIPYFLVSKRVKGTFVN